MSFVDKLKDIFKVDMRGWFNTKKTQIIIVNNPAQKTPFVHSEQNLKINFLALDSEVKKQLQLALKEAFDEKEVDLLEQISKERVEDIKEKSKNPKTQEILEFYKGKIRDDHLKALEACLYLRSVFLEGGNIKNLKLDIIKRFGDEGRNISSLCSAGYFEGYIRQVYEEMSTTSSFTNEDFKRYFRTIVRISPFAIFVSEDKDKDELSGEILHKISVHKNYGVKFLAIHGIGYKNIQKIRKVVYDLHQYFDSEPEYEEKSGIVLVKINFK